mgnify:CR=1 FL=1
MAPTDGDDESQPILPLTQELIAPIPSPPPLPPPKNCPGSDLDPKLFPHQQDASAASNTSLLHKAIITNASPTQGTGNAGWEQYFGCKIKYKGKGVQALKVLFLQSPGNHPEVPNDLYMNGIISSVPWHGHQEYGITWDTSVLPTALEKSAICHYIVKTDQHCISLLKMAWFTFDRVYPGGAKGVVNLVSLSRVRNCLQPRQVAASTATTITMNTAGTRDAVVAHESRHRQRIANMRMAPINNQFAVSALTNQLLEFDTDDDDISVGDQVNGQPPKDEDPAEICSLDQMEEDILHGYLPDPSYNPISMEDDGVYPQELNWSYSDVVPGTPNATYPHYNGKGPCLRKFVDVKFNTLLVACGTAWGFSYELVKLITMNLNAYVWARLVGNKFYGSNWKNITIEEMFHTFGMILKMSLVSICLGGLKAYFNPITKLYIFCNKAIEIKTVDTIWTNKCLT